MASNIISVVGVHYTIDALPLYSHVVEYLRRKMTNNEENWEARLPPGSTGWLFIRKSFNYYCSMTNNHPRKFVDEREKMQAYHINPKRVYIYSHTTIFGLGSQNNKPTQTWEKIDNKFVRHGLSNCLKTLRLSLGVCIIQTKKMKRTEG